MASKKKERRTRQRKEGAPEPQGTAGETEPRPPMTSLDRMFTLVGFGALIVLVIFIAPYFAHKQDRDFEQSAQKVLADLSLDAPETLPPEALEQLKALGAYPANGVGTPFFQGGAKQASVRTGIETADGLGLLSIGFLLKQELSLESRWHPVSFCRPDQQGAKVALDFLTALQARNYAAAYALSASGVVDLDKGVSFSSFEQEAKQWLSTHQAVLQKLKTPSGLPQVTAKEAALTAAWPGAGPSFLLLENPLQCAYVVQFALQ